MTTKQDAIKLALEELNIAKGHIDYRMLNSAQMAIDDAISALATKADYERAMASTAPAESKEAETLAFTLRSHDDPRLYHEADVLMSQAAEMLESLARAIRGEKS